MVFIADAVKPSLDVDGVVAEMNSKETADESLIKADFHATIEKLLSGKEIIKVAHREPRLDKPNSNHIADSKLQQLLNSHRGTGEGEVPGWLLKLYENLQLHEDQQKVQTSWLLQHLTDELISADQKKEPQPPPEHKNNDINESNSRKMANEVMQLMDSCLNLKKVDSESKLLKPLKVQILQEKLQETLVKLKSLLMERPNGWDEMYVVHVSAMKTIINKLEELLKEVESPVSKEPVFDLKTKTMSVFAINAKENLENFKQILKLWDYLAKIILEKGKSLPKNDDIILVEHKQSSAVEPPEGNDEL